MVTDSICDQFGPRLPVSPLQNDASVGHKPFWEMLGSIRGHCVCYVSFTPNPGGYKSHPLSQELRRYSLDNSDITHSQCWTHDPGSAACMCVYTYLCPCPFLSDCAVGYRICFCISLPVGHNLMNVQHHMSHNDVITPSLAHWKYKIIFLTLIPLLI